MFDHRLLIPILLLGLTARADVSVDFENRSTGTYTENMMQSDFNGLNWSNGLDQNRAKIVNDPAQGKVLRILYPEGNYGAGNSNGGGVQFKCVIGSKTEAATAEYRIKFESGFDFVKGGKLPGLCGGRCNTGGNIPTGTDGWSARYMWRADGQLVVYLYDMMSTNYGTDLKINHPDYFFFQPGKWYTIKQFIQMNTPGIRDGIIKIWVDGEQMLHFKFAKFRNTEDLGVNLFYFSTFFGGSGSEWAPPKDEHVFFDDIVVTPGSESSTRIKHAKMDVSGGTVSVRPQSIRIALAEVQRARLYNGRGVLVRGITGGVSTIDTRGLSKGAYTLVVEDVKGAVRNHTIVLH